MANKNQKTMKKISLIIFLLGLFIGSVSAQKNPAIKELVGNWNLYAMDIPGMIYFNSQTDSIWVNPKTLGTGEELNVDSSTNLMLLEVMKTNMKKEFEKMNFKIDQEGVMYENTTKIDSVVIMGKYDPATGTLTMKESKDEPEEKLSLLIDNGVLRMIKQEGELTVTMSCSRKKD